MNPIVVMVAVLLAMVGAGVVGYGVALEMSVDQYWRAQIIGPPGLFVRAWGIGLILAACLVVAGSAAIGGAG